MRVPCLSMMSNRLALDHLVGLPKYPRATSTFTSLITPSTPPVSSISISTDCPHIGSSLSCSPTSSPSSLGSSISCRALAHCTSTFRTSMSRSSSTWPSWRTAWPPLISSQFFCHLQVSRCLTPYQVDRWRAAITFLRRKYYLNQSCGEANMCALLDGLANHGFSFHFDQSELLQVMLSHFITTT